MNESSGMPQVSPDGKWIAVPIIKKWVCVDLDFPGVSADRALQMSLTLPELRLFARAAAELAKDVTASGSEWTATCVQVMDDPDGSRRFNIVHRPSIVYEANHWHIDLAGSNAVVRRSLPSSGWAYTYSDMAWIDADTGFPIATCTDLESQPDAFARTGYSYFWAPERGLNLVIRECERLHGEVMDISACTTDTGEHDEIGLRRWRPFT